MKLVLSTLPRVWLLDLDGTLVKHNGHKEGKEELLPGVKGFFENISQEDSVIILTSRGEEYREQTEEFLRRNGLRYNLIIFGLPQGERILINDMKPSGLITAYAINKNRDEALEINVIRLNEL